MLKTYFQTSFIPKSYILLFFIKHLYVLQLNLWHSQNGGQMGRNRQEIKFY